MTRPCAISRKSPEKDVCISHGGVGAHGWGEEEEEEERHKLTRKGLPVHLEIQIMRQIGPIVRLGRHAVKRMLELDLVHVNRHLRAAEVLQPAGVIEMQVPDDHHLHVLDVVARPRDGGGQLVLRAVVDAREDVVDGRAPGLGVVLAGAGFEEDESFGRVLDQRGDHGELTPGLVGLGALRRLVLPPRSIRGGAARVEG